MPKRIDFLSIGEAFVDLNSAWLNDASGLARHCRALNEAMLAANGEIGAQLRAAAEDEQPDAEKTLMKWVNTLTISSRRYHRAISDWLRDYIDLAPGLDAKARRRARFWSHQLISMLEPSNFFWTNPKAVSRFIESEGRSLSQGLRNWLDDLQRGDGLVSLADRKAFALGETLAASPGAVVYRNPLMELIQYTPQTEKVRKVPVVLIQPWINKYYIFDLSPQNSLVRHLVNQGFTVFITSWKNPTPDMHSTGFEEYLRLGAFQAVRVAWEICGGVPVHAAGYCIGGTLLTALLAWLSHDAPPGPVADATLFATLVDFSNPGDMAHLVNATSLEAIEQILKAEGRLPAHHLAAAFRLLNPADLIWRYAVNNYFLGEKPPRSDMLFWNSDSTHLPESMCRFYLRNFYLENSLVRPGALELAGRPLDLKRIRLPMYIVGASTDHICPWTATFATCRLVGGPVRFVLAGDGHITGIVNPPSPWSRKKYWAAAATRRRNAAKWQQACPPQTGSWWPDWISWLGRRGGPMVTARQPGSGDYPALEPAPGTYVRE